jgi:hypothetical protein
MIKAQMKATSTTVWLWELLFGYNKKENKASEKAKGITPDP